MRPSPPPAALIVVCALVGLLTPQDGASHSRGVGACGDCHSTHGGNAAGYALLRDQNPTDLCLSCHATEHGNTWGLDPAVPGPLYGGGSFVFLGAQNLNDGPGGNEPAQRIPGEKAGHSVISLQRGTVGDTGHTYGPGGTYPSNNLHCTSCHDPHGKGGHFRMLYGNDFPNAVVNGQTFLYTTPAPGAQGIDVDGSPESPTNHTAYRSGTSEWCGNCHAELLAQHRSSDFKHKTDRPLERKILARYDAYRGTGFLDGTGFDSYIPEVSLEIPGATTSFRGPVSETSAGITCLTCHRAHASSGPFAGRWDFKITTWIEEGVNSGTYRIPNPYESTAGSDQKQLCDKCHADF